MMSRRCAVAALAAGLSLAVQAELTVREGEDGTLSVLRDGQTVVASVEFTCGKPEPTCVRKSFETAPDGAKVWNRWSDEKEGRFRLEVVRRPDGAVEMSVLGEGHGAVSNRTRGIRLALPKEALAGASWQALVGNGRRHEIGCGTFDAAFTRMDVRWLAANGLTWDFNPRGPTEYGHSGTRNSIHGVWSVMADRKRGGYAFQGGAGFGVSYGGQGGTKLVIREGAFGDYRRFHFFDSYVYRQRLPVGRLVSFGAPKTGKDYVPGDVAFDADRGFGWVGDPSRKTVVGHPSGAYYSHVAGASAATYRFAGLPAGWYVMSVQLGNYSGTDNRFSVSVNGETLGGGISLGARTARTISKAVHVAGGTADFAFDGRWLVSAIGVQPLLADEEDFTIRRGFWYVKGYEPSVCCRSEYYGKPLRAAIADETIDMPVPGTEAAAPRRDPPQPVELPDPNTPSLAWTRDARIWLVMANRSSLCELSDDAWREEYVARGSAGKGYNAALVSGALSRHTMPDELVVRGQEEVGKLVRTFHAHGMKYIDHIDITLLWNSDIGFKVLMERLPEVLKDKFDNLPAIQFCMNSPEMKRKLFAYLRRDVELGVDGFQLDEGEFWEHGCACRTCREKFTRETGWSFPLDETDPSVTGVDTPLAKRWYDWRRKTISNWFVELRRYLKDLKPDLVLSMYTTHWGFASSHPGRGASSDLIDLGRVINFFGTEVMTRNVMQSSRPLPPLRKMKNILTCAYGAPVWGWYYNSSQSANYFSWALANMCGQSALLSDLPSDPAVPDFETWGAGPANMRKGSSPVAETAILFSGYSRDWNKGIGFIPDAMGVAQGLEALHVPYEFIGDMSVDGRTLAKYKVLFVGTAQCLSDAEIAAIRAFAAKGGRVYVTETAGTRDEIGEPRPVPAFAADLAVPGSNILRMPSAAPFYAREVSPPRVWQYDADKEAEAQFRRELGGLVGDAMFWQVRSLPDRVYTALWREKGGDLLIHFLNAMGSNIRAGEKMTPKAPDPAFPALQDDVVFTVPLADVKEVTASSPDFVGVRPLKFKCHPSGRTTVRLPKELLTAYTLVRIRP